MYVFYSDVPIVVLKNNRCRIEFRSIEFLFYKKKFNKSKRLIQTVKKEQLQIMNNVCHQKVTERKRRKFKKFSCWRQRKRK